jgi:hypothetical protein
MVYLSGPHALFGAVTRQQALESGRRVLAYLNGIHDEASRRPGTTRTRRRASLTKSSGTVSRTSQPTILRAQQSIHPAK